MKALVTGATGFIGSHLCEELIKRGYDVTCLQRKTSNLKWVENLDLKFITGDCTNLESLLRVVGGFDYVFHLAGLTKSCSEDEYFCVNAQGTENLMKAVSEKNPKIKRFIYLSSLAATGPSKSGAPLKEDTSPAPVSSYGRSKLEGEKAVLKYKNLVPFTILRPPAVYGPRDKDLLVFFKIIKKGIFPDWGKCYYSMLYVDDLIRGIILTAESKKAEDKVYFLSEDRIYSGVDIAKEISDALGVKIIRVRLPKLFMPFLAFLGERINKRGIINRDKLREISHSHWICDAGKVREEIGYITKIGLKEGIKWTADWYRIHQWL